MRPLELQINRGILLLWTPSKDGAELKTTIITTTTTTTTTIIITRTKNSDALVKNGYGFKDF